MKSTDTIFALCPTRFVMLGFFVFTIISGFSQIPPPGYDRAMQLQNEQKNISKLDRDSILITDTIAVFDPATYEESVTITITSYSIRDYCKNFLKMRDPDILLDGNPHTIIDPRTYDDLIIRYNPAGRIDTIPK